LSDNFFRICYVQVDLLDLVVDLSDLCFLAGDLVLVENGVKLGPSELVIV
jgi:hypothetical protein